MSQYDTIQKIINIANDNAASTQELKQAATRLAKEIKDNVDSDHSALDKSIENSYNRISKCISEFRSLKQTASSTDILSEIIDINNPLSPQNPYDLKKTIADLAQETIGEHYKEGSSLKTIIDNILATPLVKTFVASNPILSTVSSVFTAVTSWTNGSSKVKVPQQEAENFGAALQRRVHYFDKLVEFNNQFQNEINSITASYKTLDLRFSLMATEFMQQFFGNNYSLAIDGNGYYLSLPDSTDITDHIEADNLGDKINVLSNKQFQKAALLGAQVAPIYEEAVALNKAYRLVVDQYSQKVKVHVLKAKNNAALSEFTPQLASLLDATVMRSHEAAIQHLNQSLAVA